jgi:hypothetical protein
MKQQGLPKRAYEDIIMPKNTGSGIYISIFAFLAGFAFVWHINWLAIVSIISIIVCVIRRTFDEHTEYTITAAEVEEHEKERIKKAQAVDKRAEPDTKEDMGLVEFIKIVVTWAWDIVRNKRWRTW